VALLLDGRQGGVVLGAALVVGEDFVGLLDAEEDLGFAGGLVFVGMQPLGGFEICALDLLLAGIAQNAQYLVIIRLLGRHVIRSTARGSR
jgi:hypothetical protein